MHALSAEINLLLLLLFIKFLSSFSILAWRFTNALMLMHHGVGQKNITDKVREVLKLDNDMRELAKELMEEQSLLVFGRGYNYATALEGALKVKEVALMHSEGILAGEMKHGPLALVDENLPIIVVATRDATCR
jgi:glucosamine 6-phosphate synthetase-like amidotransferase/phosphosugar isomerase protein